MSQPLTTNELTHQKATYLRMTGIPIKPQCSWLSVLLPFFYKKNKEPGVRKACSSPRRAYAEALVSNLVTLHPFPSLRKMNYISVSQNVSAVSELIM